MSDREQTGEGAALAGTQLGRYRLGARLGAGGTVSVYLALLRGPNGVERVLAVKIVHPHLLGSARFVNLFVDEANLAVRLAHPNIVHTYEFSREDGALFLAMEYLHGQPLARLLQSSRAREERLEPELVAWIGARAAEALDYAHSLVDDAGNPIAAVHRGVSPNNVFLTYDGRVVLIDFGGAKGAGRGTRRPPLEGHRADLFDLGATLYEAAVGRSPLPDGPGEPGGGAVPPPSSVLPGFPEEFSGILLRVLGQGPALYPATARELSHDLDHFAGQNASASSLSELLAVHFGEERAAQDAAIAELYAAPALVRSLPPGLTTTAAPIAATVRPAPHQRPSRWGLLALACALTLAVGALALLFVVPHRRDADERGADHASGASPRSGGGAVAKRAAGARPPSTRASPRSGGGAVAKRAAGARPPEMAGAGRPREFWPDPRATAGNNAAAAISASARGDGGAPRFVP